MSGFSATQRSRGPLVKRATCLRYGYADDSVQPERKLETVSAFMVTLISPTATEQVEASRRDTRIAYIALAKPSEDVHQDDILAIDAMHYRVAAEPTNPGMSLGHLRIVLELAEL